MLSRYISHTFYPFNYVNMQTLSVEILIYVIALYALFITWLFEWDEMHVVLYCQTNSNVFLKALWVAAQVRSYLPFSCD